MAENICGITPTFNYMPSTMCGDFDKIDMITGSPSLSMLGMGGSIFGGCAGMPMMGCGGYDPSSYFDNMKKYQQYSTQYNIDQQKLNRNANLQIQAPMESIEDTAASLKDKILRNEQGQVMDSYRRYLESVRHAYGDGTEEEVNSRAIALYERLAGRSLVQDLRDYGSGSFVQGLKHALSFGTYARRTAEDNVADITGQDVPTGEKVAQNTGRIVGSSAIGASAWQLTKALAQKGGKWHGRAGWIGVGVGAAVALLTFLTGKATSKSNR